MPTCSNAGAFGKHLLHPTSGATHRFEPGGTFSGLVNSEQYELVIMEDEVAETAARAEQGGRSTGISRPSAPGPTRASALLTQELKGLSMDELRERGSHYKELLAARDLEDVLFGGGS